MRWQDHGLIFHPDCSYSWMQSHAQMPVVDHIENSFYRVYYASRDAQNRSHIGFFEIDLNRPDHILSMIKDPILSPGDIGYFDEHGVYPSSIVDIGNRKFLYYIGWNKGAEPPLFYAAVGLAISEDGGKTFKKHSKAPILSRSEHDPCLVTSPFVYDSKSGHHKMIYVSGIGWERDPKEGLWSHYHLKYAHSADGVNWEREGRTAIDFASSTETNLSRASILERDGKFQAFFGARGRSTPYQLAFAESEDGQSWLRKPMPIANVPESCICYPFTVAAGSRMYVFYNGERFGYEGVRLAVCA